MTRDFATLVPLGFDARMHAAFAAQADAHGSATRPARVVRADRGRVLVHDGTATTSVPLTGTFIHAPPVVGDFVALEEPHLRVAFVVQRRQLLSRRRAGSDQTRQDLAANIDAVWLASPADRFNLSWIERGVRLVRDADAIPLIVVTKSDLLGPRQVQDELFARHIYEDAVLTSAADPQSVALLQQRLPAGSTAALLGPSGAGKSTLLNALLGQEVALTQAVRQGDGKGRHTTVRRELHVLPNGGLLVDTPGIRELGFFTAEDEAGTGFDDIDALAPQCRFDDCAHLTENECAVLAAVADGSLPQPRYDSFQRQQRERRHLEEVAATSDHARRQRERGFARMVKDAKRVKGTKRR